MLLFFSLSPPPVLSVLLLSNFLNIVRSTLLSSRWRECTVLVGLPTAINTRRRREEYEVCPVTLAVSRREVKGETFQHGALRAKQREHNRLNRRRTRFFPQTAAAFLCVIVFSVFLVSSRS